MALKPTPPPQQPGPTGVGSNKPTPGVGHGPGQEPDDAAEEESQRRFREEQERDLKKGESRELVRTHAETQAGEPLTASFSITNNGTGDLDIYQLGVDPVGMINQRYMRSLKPRATVALESPMNAIRIKLAEPGSVVPTAVLYGFPA